MGEQLIALPFFMFYFQNYFLSEETSFAALTATFALIADFLGLLLPKDPDLIFPFLVLISPLPIVVILKY
jgi:hypothetical protein